eukprot:scaffold75923_cov33-Prasinocladus_malaysianus.AAC.1
MLRRKRQVAVYLAYYACGSETSCNPFRPLSLLIDVTTSPPYRTQCGRPPPTKSGTSTSTSTRLSSRRRR